MNASQKLDRIRQDAETSKTAAEYAAFEFLADAKINVLYAMESGGHYTVNSQATHQAHQDVMRLLAQCNNDDADAEEVVRRLRSVLETELERCLDLLLCDPPLISPLADAVEDARRKARMRVYRQALAILAR